MWSSLGDIWLHCRGRYPWGAERQAKLAWKGRGSHPLDFLLLLTPLQGGTDPGPLEVCARVCGPSWVIPGFSTVVSTSGMLLNKQEPLIRAAGVTPWTFCCCFPSWVGALIRVLSKSLRACVVIFGQSLASAQWLVPLGC